MSEASTATLQTVPPEEVARRIAEMRQIAFQGRAPAVVVYHPPDQPCPWPGCGYRIAGISFSLEKMVSPDRMDEYLAAWWLGPGLIARCPGCRRLVLFDVLRKDAVPDPPSVKAPQLPDNWHEKADLSPKGGR